MNNPTINLYSVSFCFYLNSGTNEASTKNLRSFKNPHSPFDDFFTKARILQFSSTTHEQVGPVVVPSSVSLALASIMKNESRFTKITISYRRYVFIIINRTRGTFVLERR